MWPIQCVAWRCTTPGLQPLITQKLDSPDLRNHGDYLKTTEVNGNFSINFGQFKSLVRSLGKTKGEVDKVGQILLSVTLV